MENVLIKAALFSVNRLLNGVDKLLLKKPKNGTLVKAREELLSIRTSLQNIKFK